MPESISWMVAVTLGLTSSGLLISRNWRISLGLFVLQYFAGFLFLLDHWLLSMSATLLVAGWMSAAALGMTLLLSLIHI